jgi:hypothetical protein
LWICVCIFADHFNGRDGLEKRIFLMRYYMPNPADGSLTLAQEWWRSEHV